MEKGRSVKVRVHLCDGVMIFITPMEMKSPQASVSGTPIVR